MYFYLLQCENRNPEVVLDGIEYIHVKAHVEGQQVAIISEEAIENEYIEEKSHTELQTILDSWIDMENEEPPQDIDGNDILQDRIVLDKFLRQL